MDSGQPQPNVGRDCPSHALDRQSAGTGDQLLGHEQSPRLYITQSPDRLHDRPRSLLAAGKCFISLEQMAVVPYVSLSPKYSGVYAPPPTTTEGISFSFLSSER